MSAGVRRTLAAGVFVLLISRPALAFVIPDPVEIAFLAKIQSILTAIERWRMIVLEDMERKSLTRLAAYAFQDSLYRNITVITTTVTDIRRELAALPCNWPTTPRTSPLLDLLLQRLAWCRNDYLHTWGTHTGMWDAELQEAHDYVGTMTANMISERADKDYGEWQRAMRDDYIDVAQSYISPGEANRNEAAAMAWTNEIALGNSQMLTQNLLVRQMGRDLDRFDQKKADDMTYYLYSGITTLAGSNWRTPPPDPAEMLP